MCLDCIHHLPFVDCLPLTLIPSFGRSFDQRIDRLPNLLIPSAFAKSFDCLPNPLIDYERLFARLFEERKLDARVKIIKFLRKSKWYKLHKSSKKIQFVKYWYHPENIGGLLAKRNIETFLKDMIHERTIL